MAACEKACCADSGAFMVRFPEYAKRQ